MSRPLTFTAAAVRHYLGDPDVPAKITDLRCREPDAEKRRLLLAVFLSEGLADIHFAEDIVAPDRETCFVNQLLELAAERINWQRVAKALLEHFTLPVIIVGHTPQWQDCPRMKIWEPVN